MSGSSTGAVAVVLAAGKGSRFGGDKLLATLSNQQVMIQQVIDRVSEAFDHWVCVVRAEDQRLQEYLSENNCPWVVAPDAALGMSASIQMGVNYFSNAKSWLFVLADMPYVEASSYKDLYEKMKEAGESPSIVIPRYRAQKGNPVSLSRHFISELKLLKGDMGARPIVKQNPHAHCYVDLEDAGVLLDIDQKKDVR